MKKVTLITAGLTLATTVVAAPVNFASSASPTPQALSVANCALLQEAVNIALSKNNLGSIDCNTTTGYIGAAAASTSGKGKVYSAGSNGGAVTEGSCAAAVCVTTDASGAATTKASGS